MAKLSRGLAFVELVTFVFLLTIVENPGPCMSWWVKPRDPIQSLFPMAFDVHLTKGLLIGSSNQGLYLGHGYGHLWGKKPRTSSCKLKKVTSSGHKQSTWVCH